MDKIACDCFIFLFCISHCLNFCQKGNLVFFIENSIFQKLFLIFELFEINLKLLVIFKNFMKICLFFLAFFVKDFSMIFINNNLCPFSESIDFKFCLLLNFIQFFNVFFQLSLFVNKLESLCLILIYLFNHSLSIVVNVLVILSFSYNLIF